METGYIRDLAGMEESQLTVQKIACRFNRGPVTEHLLVIFKGLGLVAVRDVDRFGASDMETVGMREGREGREAHLFEPTSQLVEEFDLLFNHWDE